MSILSIYLLLSLHVFADLFFQSDKKIEKNALKTYKPKIYQTISELRKIYDLPAQAKRSPKDQNLYMEDFYKEQNYYYEPTFNDHKFAERVEALFQGDKGDFLCEKI